MLEMLVTNPAVQGAIVVVVVAFVGFVAKQVIWVRHVVAIGIQAYTYAETEGVFRGLQGYDKFGPFMTKFIEQYWEKYGKLPTPKAKAVAVGAMERAVEEEYSGNY